MTSMDDARIVRAEQVFDAVVNLPPDQRAAALEQCCCEDMSLRAFVERLLRLDDLTTDEIEKQMPFHPPPSDRSLSNTIIGRYRIKRVIASGGMGTVYEAEQEKPRRTVAVKVMSRGIASRSALRRFEYESQILARLRHPGIAQVYEAGTQSGAPDIGREVPYFVMEYIPSALPITQYAEQNKLSTRRRLELFIEICEAVHHGHQKGVIHRDLKPANILVDSGGEVKIIDFGVARATDSDMAVTTMQTDVGQLIGTLQYMSPEQCDADPHDLDVRSDVYALGVVLYELLTEQLPYDVTNASVYEATRIIREHAPARPSTFNRTLRGDLETITLKALEKDRERRYQSAADLAEDVRRYLTSRPIRARPPSAVYQFRTFARRNKALVGGVTATFIALIAGLIGVTAMYVQAEHLRAAEAEQRRFAEQREQEALSAKEAEAEAREEADKIAEFQQSQLAGIEAAGMGAGIRTSIIEKRRAALAGAGYDHDEIERALRDLEGSLAGVNFTNVALEALDEYIFDRALNAMNEQLDEHSLVKARLLQTLSGTMILIGLFDRSLAPQVEALELRQRVLGDEHPDTLDSMNSLGTLLHHRGQLAEAEPYWRAALEGRRRVLGNDHPATIQSMNNMALLHQQQGQLADAERLWREALEASRRVLGDDHEYTVYIINSMGFLLVNQGKLDEAAVFAREAVEKSRRILGDEHQHTLITLNNLANVLRRQGNLAEAEQYLHEALEGARRVLGDEHPRTLTLAINVGRMLQDQGKLTEAEPYFLEALEGRRRIFGDEHPETISLLHDIGALLYGMDRFADGEPYVREALERRRRLLGNEHPDTCVSMHNLAQTLRELGQLTEAEQLAAEVVQTARAMLPTDHGQIAVYLSGHGRTLTELNRFTEAQHRLREAHAIFDASPGEHHDHAIRVLANLAALYDAWHESEPDVGHDVTAAEWRAKLEGRNHDAHSSAPQANPAGPQ